MQYFFPFIQYHLDFYWAPSLSSPAAAADSSCVHWQPPTLNVHVSLLQEKQSKGDLQPKGFVQCMYKAAGSVEMDAPRSAVNSEGWGSVDEYSSFAIPWWDTSEGSFSGGPQRDWALAAHSGHQLIRACFIGIPPTPALLPPLVFLEILFLINTRTQHCLRVSCRGTQKQISIYCDYGTRDTLKDLVMETEKGLSKMYHQLNVPAYCEWEQNNSYRGIQRKEKWFQHRMNKIMEGAG